MGRMGLDEVDICTGINFVDMTRSKPRLRKSLGLVSTAVDVEPHAFEGSEAERHPRPG